MGINAGTVYLSPAAGKMTQVGFGHLASTAISGTEDKDAFHGVGIGERG
jgi:hypothetical protein